jgi:TonB family protein
MKRRDPSFVIGMSISVILHGILAIVGVVVIASELIDLLNKASQAVVIDGGEATHSKKAIATILLPPPPPADAKDQSWPKLPTEAAPPPPPQTALPDSAQRTYVSSIPDIFGDSIGKGDSPNSSDGDKPMHSSLQAFQDQAMLTRTRQSHAISGGSDQVSKLKTGDSGSGGNDGQSPQAADSSTPFGAGATGQPMLAPKSTPRSPQPAVVQRPVQTPLQPPPAPPAPAVAVVQPPNPDKSTANDSLIAMGSTIPLTAAHTTPTTPVTPAVPQLLSPPAAPATQPATQSPPAESVNPPDPPNGGAARPGLPGNPGPTAASPYAAPLGVSDSDPYSKIPTVDMRYGKVEARLGRKIIRTVRPQLGLAGEIDVATSISPVVTLAAKIDEEGRVTDVSVVRSSGSENIDTPCERAVEQWIFQPTVDPKTGKGVPDMIIFSLIF